MTNHFSSCSIEMPDMERITLEIMHGKLAPLTDPEHELQRITAISLPQGNTRHHVCFVRFHRIVELAGERVLYVKAHTGNRSLSMTRIVYRNGKWCTVTHERPVYILLDATRRFHGHHLRVLMEPLLQ